MIQFADFMLRNGKAFLLAALLTGFLSACGGSDDNGGPDVGGPNPGVDDSDDDNSDDDNSDDDDSDDDNSDDDNSDDDNSDDDSGDGRLAFETFQPASLVIGQQDFTGGDEDQGGTAPDANTLDQPMGGVAYSAENDIMFIADSGNVRVLGYSGIPETNNANADLVLGQPDFTSDQAGDINSTSMFAPENVTTQGGVLMVTDTDLNRVMVYDGIPQSGDAEPIRVLGQSSMDTVSGACDDRTFIHPHASFHSPDGKILVADAANNRVLVWNEMPEEDGAPADFVLGQINFLNCSNQENENFQHPAAMWTDGEQLIVADSEKHRVLIWNTFPTEGFQAPDVILGQNDRANREPNDDDQDGQTDEGGAPTARTLNYPRGLDVHDGRLYVADMDNHRVLIWNDIPTESFAPADVVIGQEDFTSNEPNAGEEQPNDQGINRPVGISVIGNQLFVTEWDNSRVTVFDGQ